MSQTKVIKLSGKRAEKNNAYAVVDEDDYEMLVAMGKWHLNDMGYAVRRGLVDGKNQTIRMHRLINQTPDGLMTDHINRVRLDNRKNNLRSVTQRENMQNIEQGVGYWYHKRNKNWCVEVYGKKVGTFDSEEFANQIATMIYDGELPLTKIKVYKPYTPYCKRGHNKEEVGTYYEDSCKSCILENQRNYYIRRTHANT